MVTGVCYKGTDGEDHVASAHLTVGLQVVACAWACPSSCSAIPGHALPLRGRAFRP